MRQRPEKHQFQFNVNADRARGSAVQQNVEEASAKNGNLQCSVYRISSGV